MQRYGRRPAHYTSLCNYNRQLTRVSFLLISEISNYDVSLVPSIRVGNNFFAAAAAVVITRGI